jgi:hypothetical protein
MEEIKAVVANDDSQSSWSELLVEPHNRGTSIYQNNFSLWHFTHFCFHGN